MDDLKEIAEELAEENDLTLLSVRRYRKSKNDVFRCEIKYRLERPIESVGRNMPFRTEHDKMIAETEFVIDDYCLSHKGRETAKNFLEQAVLETIHYYTSR